MALFMLRSYVLFLVSHIWDLGRERESGDLSPGGVGVRSGFDLCLEVIINLGMGKIARISRPSISTDRDGPRMGFNILCS